MMFSQAAFMIENPGKGKDDLGVYTAGVEGALKVYEAILREKPKAQSPFLDELVRKRNNGELGKYVRQTMVKCKR